MARKTKRRQAPPGGLSVRQRWFLHRGYKFYSLSGFFHGRCQVPFESEAAVRQAYFDHRAELLAEARQPLPESVKRELILRPKYCRPATTWAFRPMPKAFYEYEPAPDGAETETKSPKTVRTGGTRGGQTASRKQPDPLRID